MDVNWEALAFAVVMAAMVVAAASMFIILGMMVNG